MGRRGSPPTVDWLKLDWRKQDIQLAEETGLCRERVRQMRRVLKKKKPQNERNRRDSAYVKLVHVKTSTMTLDELATEYGYTHGHLRNVLTRMGKTFKVHDNRCRGKYDWASISKRDWQRLTDKEVAKRLGVKNPAVVTLWRIRHNIFKKSRAKSKPIPKKPVRKMAKK